MLDWQPFAQEKLVLLTAADVTETDPLALLASMPYIRHTRRASVGLLVEDWLSEHDVRVNTSMEMESLESVASMVSYGLGVSIAPDICVPDPIFAGLRKLTLDSPDHVRVLGVVTRKNCSKKRLVERLMVEIRQSISQYSATPT